MHIENRLRQNLLTATYVFLLILLLKYMSNVTGFLSEVVSLCSPFIFGFVLAFLLKGIVNFYETKILRFNGKKGAKRLIAIVLTYLSVCLIIMALISLVLPQIVSSINVLVAEIPQQYKNFKDFAVSTINELNFQKDFWMKLWLEVEGTAMQLLNEVGKMAYNMIPSIVATTKSITSSVTTGIFGFVISLYMLANKEKLQRQFGMLLKAILPKLVEQKIVYVAKLMNKTFSNFIVGQITEAFILGILCFIGMLICRMPYALLVSIIIGASNIIPIFGPIIGTIPATFIVLMANPTKPITAVWFIILVLVIQRIDNDIIYPRVVGNSVGLSALWVMLAILVGGGLFGLAGMVLGVPMCAVVYQLVKEYTYQKLEQE